MPILRANPKPAGYILLVVLVVTTLLLVTAGILVTVRQQWSANSSKRSHQGLATVLMNNEMSIFRKTLVDELADGTFTTGAVTAGSPFFTPTEWQDTASSTYALQPPVIAFDGPVALTQQHDSAQITSFGGSDPYAGVPATVSSVSVTQMALLKGPGRGQGESAAVSADKYLPQDVRGVTQVAIRQIPVSAFNVYAPDPTPAPTPPTPPALPPSNLLLTPAIFAGRNVGRVHAGGQLVIVGGAQAIASVAPLTAVGDIGLLSGSTIITPLTGTTGLTTPTNLSTATQWNLDNATTFHFTIQCHYDAPLALIQLGKTSQEITAENTTAASLYSQCAVKITVADSTLPVSISPLIPNAATLLTSEVPAVLLVDYHVLAALSTPPASLYIKAPSGTRVAIVNARQLAGPLSIVTPNEVYISGGFNDAGTVYPASLITAGKVHAETTAWGQDLLSKVPTP